MQILESFGLIVTEVCCHKLNMNGKEIDIIKRILKGEIKHMVLAEAQSLGPHG